MKRQSRVCAVAYTYVHTNASESGSRGVCPSVHLEELEIKALQNFMSKDIQIPSGRGLTVERASTHARTHTHTHTHTTCSAPKSEPLNTVRLLPDNPLRTSLPGLGAVFDRVQNRTGTTTRDPRRLVQAVWPLQAPRVLMKCQTRREVTSRSLRERAAPQLMKSAIRTSGNCRPEHPPTPPPFPAGGIPPGPCSHPSASSHGDWRWRKGATQRPPSRLLFPVSIFLAAVRVCVCVLALI